MKTIRECVAEELRAIRSKKQYSQKQVADGTGLDVMTIGRYENNNTSMQLDVVDKILTFYNVSIDIFFRNISANMHEKD